MSMIEPAAPVPVAPAAGPLPAAGHDHGAVRLGYAFAAASAILFATKGIFVKLAYEEGVDATTLLALRLGLSLPVYLVVGALSLRDRHRSHRGLPDRRLVLGAAGAGILGYYVSSYTDFLGLITIPVQFERMILFTYPLFVVIFGALFFGQRTSRAVLLAIAVSYAGLVVMFAGKVGELGADAAIGAGWVLACAVTFAWYQLLAKPLIVGIGPRLFTCIAMIAAAAVGIGQFFLTHPLSDLVVSGAALGYAVLLAVLATILPTFLLAAALHRIAPQANATIGMLSPVATIALAALVLGEVMTGADWVGTVIVLAGVGWMTLRLSAAGRSVAR